MLTQSVVTASLTKVILHPAAFSGSSPRKACSWKNTDGVVDVVKLRNLSVGGALEKPKQ